MSTHGLRRKGQAEITGRVADQGLVQEAKCFLRFIAAYLKQSGRKILAGETLTYGYWVVKLIQRSDAGLEVWEFNADATDFIPGGSHALRYWQEQHAICSRYNAMFAPPTIDSITVLSAGVWRGFRCRRCITLGPIRSPDGCSLRIATLATSKR